MDRSAIIGIYQVAGQSRRMGTNKLNLPAGKELLGSIAFHAAIESKLTSTIAVTRKGAIPELMNLAGGKGARSFIRGEVSGKKIELEDNIVFLI